MRRWMLVALCLLACCAAASCKVVVVEGARAGPTTAVVERVVDGDTVVVNAEGARLRVRLIGVDTPETVKPGTPPQCFGREASAFAARELTGASVRLAYDVDREDRYGRTLAYLFRGDELFNRTLIERGYGVVLAVPPNVVHAADFLRAQRRARAANRGLWGACPARD